MQVPSFSAQTLLQPAVYAGLPCSFALQALFFFGARRAWPSAFTTSAQTSWILTTMSSIVMTTASLPFVVDYFAHDTDLSAMPLLNSPWAVAVSMYFISYLVCDLAIGYVYYKDQIDMVTGWLHHLIYPIVLLAVVLFQIPGAFMVAAFMELPTIILALGHMKRSFRSEYLFGFSFFVTRIVFHLYFAWRTFTVWWSVFPAVMILALGTFPLHIYWFGCWVRRQIRIYKKSRSLAARLASAETEDEGVTAASRTTTGTYASLEEAPIIAVLESGSERQSIVSVGERAVLGKTHLVSFAPGYGTISTAASDSDGIRPVTPPNRDEQASRHSRSIPRDSLQIEVVPVYRHSRASTSSLGASVVSQLSFVVSSPNRDGVDPDRLSEEDVEEIIPMPFVRWYSLALQRRPLLTQALTTGALFASGDLIAQVGVERKTSDYNPLRTARLGLFGSCVAGPAMVSWYGLLSRRIVFENRLMALLARVSLDQLVFAPTFIAIFFSATGFMEGLTPEAVWDKLKSGYPTALAGNYKLWPAVQLVNFYLVPLHHQALVVNTIALGWNTYLSVINQRSTFKENPEST